MAPAPTTQTHPEPASVSLKIKSLIQTKQWREALQLLDELVLAAPPTDTVHLMRARCHVQLNAHMPAREAFAQTLRLNPNNYSAWLEAGHLCRQMGEIQQALLSYQKAIQVAPQRYEALLGTARVHVQQEQWAMADLAYAKAQQAAQTVSHIALHKTQQLMGQYCLERGQPERALTCLQQALAVPDIDENNKALAYIDGAMALLRLGQRDTAFQWLTRASAATDEDVLSRLAILSYRNNLWQEAVEVMRKCVALYPQSKNAHWNLANVLAECWQMKEAIATLQKAEALGPVLGAQSLRAAIAGKTGDADKALALYLDLAHNSHDSTGFASSAAMSSLYTDQLSATEVAALHRNLFASWGEGARTRCSFLRQPLAGRRLRLGLVSADFHHQHPVNIFLQPFLRELDKTRFELFMYYTGESHDEQTALAQQRCEHWREATSLDIRQLAKRIDADEIDVLLDLSGHTGQHRMQMFAKRAAPVQMTYLGYPGSTGVPNIDFMLGDHEVTPPDADALCSETVLRLPNTVFCFAPEVDYPLPAFAPSDAQRTLTFGSFNNAPKLTGQTLSLWARVLQAVPESRLVLKAPSFSDDKAVAFFTERLQTLGLDVTRVEFRGPVGLTDMMAEYADIDIALDPAPYNGGTTTLQAMWMGVPVVTMRGHHFVSRMGASFMCAAGLSEWVAKDDDAYVAIAKRMATDRSSLLALKRDLRRRTQALPAWDPVAQTRAIEDAITHAATQMNAAK
jgi:predicted O-linked N-acetylglucosamine transferase (SPINDLY family)